MIKFLKRYAYLLWMAIGFNVIFHANPNDWKVYAFAIPVIFFVNVREL